jgi:hypothetical protein
MTRGSVELGIVVALAAGFGATGAWSAQSLSVEQYVGCAEEVASESAKRHIGDAAVVRSPFPGKVLREFAYDDVFKACRPQYEALDSSQVGEPSIRADDAIKTAIGKALAEGPKRTEPPQAGSDDYDHGEKLAPGAILWLSPECKALLNDDFVAPASCSEAVREANSRQNADELAKTERLANLPVIQYCMGLKRTAPKNPNDPFEGVDDNVRRENEARLRLKNMETAGWEELNACAARVRSAGGLVFLDPVDEIARVNQIPEVKDASDQYSKCTLERAIEFARVSNEPAEIIARAALGGCGLLRQQYLTVLARVLGIVMTSEIAAQEEKETTGALIGHIIAARAASAQGDGGGAAGK